MNPMTMFTTMAMMNELLFPTFQQLEKSIPFNKRHALVKFGGGITQMAGSIAGNVFARNRYGNYVRARTKPTNPNTARQQTVRAALAMLTQRWSQTLDAAQRIAWDLYAANVIMTNRLGEATHLSGYNHYLRSNIPREQFGRALVDDGPVVFELPAQDPTFLINGSELTQLLELNFDVTMDWATEAGAFIFWYQGQPQNAQRNFFGGPWRSLTWLEGLDPGPLVSPQNIPAVFAIAELQHQWIYARISRADGRLSEPFRDNCFTGA